MSRLSRLLSLFPVLVLLISASCFALAAALTSVAWLFAAAAVLYLLPLLAYRLLMFLAPVEEGRSYLDAPRFSPWWGSHEIQKIYIALPFLESLLQLVPGAFSLWLRLWGSRIGRGVYWSSRVEVTDRGLLDVGSNVVFGHKVLLFGHVVKPARRGMILYVKRVQIGDAAFISAGSRIGPGARVAPGSFVPILSDLYVGAQFPPIDRVARNEHELELHEELQ